MSMYALVHALIPFHTVFHNVRSHSIPQCCKIINSSDAEEESHLRGALRRKESVTEPICCAVGLRPTASNLNPCKVMEVNPSKKKKKKH